MDEVNDLCSWALCPARMQTGRDSL